MVGYQKIKLMPGQFVFGRRVASKETGLSHQNIRTCLKVLTNNQPTSNQQVEKNTEKLTIKTTNKFSIITIVNWDTYQIEMAGANQLSNQLLTNKPEKLTTNKNVKNVKNKEIKERYVWLDLELWEDFRKHRTKLKSPLTPRAETAILNKLEKNKNNGTDPNTYILKSIERGWKSVFPDETTSGGFKEWKPKPITE